MKIRAFLLFFFITTISVLVFSPFLVFKSNAASLGEGYLLFDTMKIQTAADMTVMFTPGSNFDDSGTTKEFKVFFPESQGAWCLQNGASLTINAVSSSPVDNGDWSIDFGLPGVLVATCHQGGASENDYIKVTGITNLLANTSYGFEIASNIDVFRLGSNSGNNLISFQLIEGSKVEAISFGINLLGNDRVTVGAYVVETNTITCNVGGNVNLGTLYLGGSYVTGDHVLGISSSGTGFYWTVRGQNAGLSHNTQIYILSSLGVGGIVDLLSSEGFGLVISSSNLGTVQPNYLPSSPGQFGAIDTTPKLILGSQDAGNGDYGITLGARASVGATTGAYQESLTYICGGYIQAPPAYSCYIMQGHQVQGIHSSDQYNYAVSCGYGYSWSIVSSAIFKDNVTGLYWSEASPTTLSHADSITYCNNLNLGGRTDWRIPTKDELMQISPSPCYAIGCGSYYGNNMYGYSETFTTTNWFWSLNEVSDNTTEAWWVGLFDGRVFSTAKTATNSARVRCVTRD